MKSDRIHAKIREAHNLCANRDYDQALVKYREAVRLVPEPFDEHQNAAEIIVGIGEAHYGKKDFSDDDEVHAVVTRIDNFKRVPI